MDVSFPQSALEPAGREAEDLARLFWWLTGGAAIIWLIVVGLTLYSALRAGRPRDRRGARLLVIGGGVVFPTVVLGGVLTYALSMLPSFLAPAPEGSVQVEVAGERWWWRVRYRTEDGNSVELANEIRLPVDTPVEFLLSTRDVIHSFWIPSLAGKVDMIPGRQTRLRLQPTRTGTFRGVCAEYCGASHALMSFPVVVQDKAEFERWLSGQAEPAKPPADAVATRLQRRFLANGCGSCHAIRGTPADGVIGPDLTHVGSRLSIGAGVLPSQPEDFHRWIAHTTRIKPSVLMPAFGMLPEQDLRDLANFLDALK